MNRIVLSGPSILLLFTIILWPFYALCSLYVMQWYWLVLKSTANDEDDVQWFATDWNLWEDAVKPTLWILTISFLCSLPALLIFWYVDLAVPVKTVVILAALPAGWFFWPVAVMSVALGNTILFIRPDWLVRCIWGIGPVYALAWMVVMMTIGFWGVFLVLPPPPMPTTLLIVVLPLTLLYRLATIGINLYFGYVLFRMLGLIFRHFRTRFPWKY